MKNFFKRITDLVLYAILFFLIGVYALSKAIVNEDYGGANFKGGIVSILISSFILIRYTFKNRK